MILASAILLIVQKATGYALGSFGGLVVPFEEDWWRYFTAPFAYVDVGFLFAVSLALAIFATGVERRLGTVRTAILLIACGSLGMVAADGGRRSRLVHRHRRRQRDGARRDRRLVRDPPRRGARARSARTST